MKENPTKRCTATRYTARVNADVRTQYSYEYATTTTYIP